MKFNRNKSYKPVKPQGHEGIGSEIRRFQTRNALGKNAVTLLRFWKTFFKRINYQAIAGTAGSLLTTASTSVRKS